MIICCSGVIGIMLSRDIYEKIEMCTSLLELCSILRTEISVRKTPIRTIVKQISENEMFSLLNFMNEQMLYSIQIPKTSLSDVHNKKIGEFIYSLGKDETGSQLESIDTFEEFTKNLKLKYESEYKSKSRLYITVGTAFGIILCIMLI